MYYYTMTELIANVTLANPCYTFTSGGTFNIHSLTIDKVLIEPPGTLTYPLETLPLLTPGSDVKCPDTPTGQDPMISSVIDQGQSISLNWLIFTNNGDFPTAPSPTKSTGPWYFEKEPFSSSNKTVITCGCRETFDPTSTRDDERFPPHESNTHSIIDLTFDTGILDPKTSKIALDITFGYSSEANYDFFTISAEGDTLFQGSGPGISASDPYKHGTISLLVNKTATVRIQYYRDPATYGGVDSVYFRINKAQPFFDLAFPSTLILKRGTTVLKDYTPLIELDSTQTSLTIDCAVNIQTGDQLCLTADSGVYSQFNVTASYQNIPQIYDHRYEETFYQPVNMDTIRYNNREVTNKQDPQGWYNTDDQFAENLVYITQVSGCSTGGPNQLTVRRFSLASSGPYFVNGYWAGDVHGVVATMTEISHNVYKHDATGYIYIFNSSTGELRLDTSDPNNIPSVGNSVTTIFRPVKNTDERYWQYQMELSDPDKEFNPPLNFFDFVGEYYKCGQISSQFGIKSFPTWPDINPLKLDQTQVAASYGVSTKAQYDDLYRRLRDIGIKRQYQIQRWIYWPYPGVNQPQLTEEQQSKLRWVVNQQRYPYLGFTTLVPNEGEHNYPRLGPGETVKIYGTKTSLDGCPLRLAMDGYHTGPKPPQGFTRSYSGKDPRNGELIPSEFSFDSDKEWAYYTLRLPITIDSSNDTVYSRGGGLSRDGEPPYYLNMYTTVIPGPNLGPYAVASTLYGKNLGNYPLAGKVVKGVPLNGSTPFTNGAQINGNVVIVAFEPGMSLSSSAICNNAIAAGAVGVILIDNSPTNPVNINIRGFNGRAPIPSCEITNADGNAIINAIDAGKTVSVNVKLESPILKTTLPHGTFYLTDLFQKLFDDYVAGKNEFYIEVGNFISGYYGWNDIFALSGSGQALLFGPNDAKYKSNFFGPTGLDVAYLWNNSPSTPLVTELQFQSANFYDGTYAQLQVGQYKTHTPLTSAEAKLLIDSLNKTCDVNNSDSDEDDGINGPYVVTKHGPVQYDMPYEKFIACINELSIQKGTEDHDMICPWVRKSDNGMYELPIDMQKLLDDLKTVSLDPTFTYITPFNDIDGIQEGGVSPIPGVPISATFAPTIYCMPIRATGVGHPGEFSEMYNAGYARINTEDQARGESRLEWIIPRDGTPLVWPSPTVLPTIGDISGRDVEIPIVNYLEDPQWLGFTTAKNGAPDYYFIPYRLHTGNNERIQEGVPIDPNAVAGDWLIGVLKDSKVRSILGLPDNSTPPRYGYITWYTSNWTSQGDSSLLPWYDPKFSSVDAAAIVAAARILQYFNQQNVKHIIIDVRNTVGGSEPFWNAFSALIGGKRYFNLTDVTPVMTLEPNGIQEVRTTTNFQVAKEDVGNVTYKYQKTILDCNPDAFVAAGLLNVVPGGVWNGEVTGQAALGQTSNIIWISNATTISNTQYKCLFVKSTSLDQQTYNGDFGKSTQFVQYGVYDRPFSTSGGYESYINWWTTQRTGEEENPIGLMFSIDRWEASRTGYMHGNVDGKGGVLKGLDQEFGPLQKPHIKWDMNATVFFQDIGYTSGNAGINPITDGQPWAPKRYNDVIFGKPETYRDSALERIVQMANDNNLTSHFYQDDGYGYVTALPVSNNESSSESSSKSSKKHKKHHKKHKLHKKNNHKTYVLPH